MTDLSPFIEGTKVQWCWDSTSLGWLKTCPRYYQYSMIEHWRSRGNSVHLDFGLWYHDALESYDKWRAEGQDHKEALRNTVLKCLTLTWHETANQTTGEVTAGPWVSDHNLKTRETLIRSVIWYLEEFGPNDAAQTIILDNGKPAVELSFKLDLDYSPKTFQDQAYFLSGHLDRVVNFNEGQYIMDRKTSSTTIGSYYFDGYSPDNQMSLYTLAAKIIYQTPVKGVIIDAVQIAVGFSRYSRGFTFRTETQIEEWLNDTKIWLDTAERYALAEYWPMQEKSCGNYGGCTFRKICSKSPEVRYKFLESDFIKSEWNPLRNR